VSGSETKNETFVWCGSRICQKRASNGTTVVRSYFGEGFEVTSGPTKYFYTRDHLGSVREVVANDGTSVSSRLSYDPWGKMTETGSALTDFGFTGHHYDRPTGLDLTRYRGYDPNTGRWLSRDPIGLRGGLNLYGYVDNDPTNQIDPDGRCPLCVLTADVLVDILIGGGALHECFGPLFGPRIERIPDPNVRRPWSAGPSQHDRFERVIDVPGRPPFTGPPGDTIRGPKQTRTYAPDGYPETDRDVGHPGHGDPNDRDHVHDWGRPAGGGPPTATDRGPGRDPTPADPPQPSGGAAH